MIKNHKSGIYIIKNLVDGKVYIGQSRSITSRWKVHKNLLKNNKHYNRHLQSAFNKFGIENFEYSILQLCDIKEFDEKESFWISHYESNNEHYGYNLDSGGGQGKELTDYAKAKIALAAQKRGIAREVQEKAWEVTRSRKREQHPMFGKKHKKESKEKMSKARIGRTFIHTEETKRKIGKANSLSKKGKKLSEAHRQKLFESNAARKQITEGMINDVRDGLSRRKFKEKYGCINPWNRIFQSIKNEGA